MDNCRNCGAPLPKSGKCEYCGTEYNQITSHDNVYYKINFDGSDHVCYMKRVDIDILDAFGPRYIDGTMVNPKTVKKFRFELVEV